MEHLKDLCHFYENEGDERLRLHKDSIQHLEFLTATKYIDKALGENSAVLDSCAGSGVYAFYLAKKGHRVTAGDIVGHNVALIREKEEREKCLQSVQEMDARNLSMYEDSSFDAVLCMGALYHLHEKEDRRKVISESLRVLKPGGILACTYMNRYAVIMNNIGKDFENIEDAMQFSKNGTEGIYYADTPTNMEKWLAEYPLEKHVHIPLDGMTYFLTHTAGILQSDEAFKRWKEYHFAVCEDESLLGSSYHNMYIAKKL